MAAQQVGGSVPADDVESLATTLRGGSRKARLNALEAIAAIGRRPGAADVIADTALGEGDLDLRARAAQVLADLRDPRAPAALLAVLEAGWDVAWIGAVGEPVRQAIARLAEVRDEAVVDGLLELMRARRGQRGPWAQVCTVLGAYRDPRAVPELLEVVRGHGPLTADDKVAAIEAIETIGHVDAEVAAALGSASGTLPLPRTDRGRLPGSVEAHATNALLDIIDRSGDPPGFEVLAAVLSSARNPHLRGKAAAALAEHPDDPRVVTALEHALRTERDSNALSGIVRGLEATGSAAAAEGARQLERQGARDRVEAGVLVVVAGLLGIVAAGAGVYFALGTLVRGWGPEGLYVALAIWVVAAGPLLGWTAKNLGRA